MNADLATPQRAAVIYAPKNAPIPVPTQEMRPQTLTPVSL